MGRMTPWLLGAVVMGAGCTREDPPMPEPRGVDVREARAQAQARASERLYDSEGALRESDEVVAGLRLPVGLERIHGDERRHVYRTRVPLRAVQRYFGPRLVTGEVDRLGDGAIYRRAVPKDVRGGVVKLDVSILPVASGTRVEIVEIRPPPQNPPGLEELRRWSRDVQWQ